MGSNSSLLFAMGLMIIVYYFLLIRPQQQRVKRHKQMINDLRKGDRVVTQGGILGKVSALKAEANEVEIEIASGVKIQIIKSTIQTVLNKTEPAAANAPAKPAAKAKSSKK